MLQNLKYLRYLTQLSASKTNNPVIPELCSPLYLLMFVSLSTVAGDQNTAKASLESTSQLLALERVRPRQHMALKAKWISSTTSSVYMQVGFKLVSLDKQIQAVQSLRSEKVLHTPYETRFFSLHKPRNVTFFTTLQNTFASLLSVVFVLILETSTIIYN